MKLRAKRGSAGRIKLSPAHGNFFRRPSIRSRWAHVHDDVQVVAHHHPRVHAAGKNISQLQNTGFNPHLSVLEAFAEIFIQAAQPRSAHAAVDAIKRSGMGWVNELAAGLGYGRSLDVRALFENQIGCNLGSDLSEGWVSAPASPRRLHNAFEGEYSLS